MSIETRKTISLSDNSTLAYNIYDGEECVSCSFIIAPSKNSYDTGVDFFTSNTNYPVAESYLGIEFTAANRSTLTTAINNFNIFEKHMLSFLTEARRQLESYKFQNEKTLDIN